MPYSGGYYHSYPYNTDSQTLGYKGGVMPRLNRQRVAEIRDVTDKRDLIRASIEAIIGTERYARVMLPNFGCKLRDLLFEPLDEFLIQDLKEELKQLLVQEPRITVDDVDIKLDYDNYTVYLVIDFRFIDTYTSDTYIFTLKY